jgi:hypothetical protein
VSPAQLLARFASEVSGQTHLALGVPSQTFLLVLAVAATVGAPVDAVRPLHPRYHYRPPARSMRSWALPAEVAVAQEAEGR